MTTTTTTTKPAVITFYIRENPYGWMSNFWRSQQTGSGTGGPTYYPTNEHYYQANKAATKELHDWIANAPTAWHAMKAGRALKETETMKDWNAPEHPVKLDVMLQGLRLKFYQNKDLAQLLMDTGDAILHEQPESPYTDSFWGNSPKPDGSPGDSHLGRLLMRVREELRQHNAKRGA